MSTIVPFVIGGGELIVDWLNKKLIEYGFSSESIKIPFQPCYTEMLQQMLAIRLLDLTEYCDKLIAIRTPSYLIKHPDKVLWFIHHHRGAYDLWGTPYQDIPNTPEGLEIRDAIISADNLAFGEASKIYTNSKVISDRLKRFNGVNSEILYPPLMDSEKYHSGEFGKYIFYPSRMNGHKRQHLAIEAMQYTRSNVKLIVAGSPYPSEYSLRLEEIVREKKLTNKVKIISKWITDESKIELLANCLGCVYIPVDEDSYGYVSLEAYHSKKPVITCSDSGGTLEMVEDGINGFVCSADPKAIAESFDRLEFDRESARKMGQAGCDKIIAMGISWDNVVEKLTK